MLDGESTQPRTAIRDMRVASAQHGRSAAKAPVLQRAHIRHAPPKRAARNTRSTSTRVKSRTTRGVSNAHLKAIQHGWTQAMQTARGTLRSSRRSAAEEATPEHVVRLRSVCTCTEQGEGRRGTKEPAEIISELPRADHEFSNEDERRAVELQARIADAQPTHSVRKLA